jgi:hypothetical protein
MGPRGSNRDTHHRFPRLPDLWPSDRGLRTRRRPGRSQRLRRPGLPTFVDQAATLGTAGLVHLACFISDHGDRALAELLHAPKARAMARP